MFISRKFPGVFKRQRGGVHNAEFVHKACGCVLHRSFYDTFYHNHHLSSRHVSLENRRRHDIRIMEDKRYLFIKVILYFGDPQYFIIEETMRDTQLRYKSFLW